MKIALEQWKNPEKQHRVNPMMHAWPKDRTILMDAIKDYGFGGVVTNPSYDNWYAGYPENAREFKNLLAELDERGLDFWIYDEKGYPSGYAGGETLVGHPELEAKGFYMRRMVAYEPRHVKFHLDDESDKIVWVAKYDMITPGMHESFLVYESMEPVPFTDTFVETDLAEKQAFFVFCVKPAYEGSHCTHNVSSYSRYVNIMNPDAIKRFIELMLEPIAKGVPDAFRRAKGVFTDEPSLQVGYARPYESWPYALAPYVDGIFEEYEAEYGESILPTLPLLFEGRNDAYPTRINFYRLVGKLVARAYSEQLSTWCREHGGRFSGHYLGEETMVGHVKDYGSNIEVMSKADYPGLDVLECFPEVFSYNTVKHPQMVARKKGTDGMMVEICPFFHHDEFMKDPIENMTAIMGVLYLGGVRVTHSYFTADYSEYDPEKLGEIKGTMSRKEARQFNNYVGRLGTMLSGITNDTHTFVYYGIEDVQAKMVPQTTAFSGEETHADNVTIALTKAIYDAGHDFYYADRDDIVAALEGDVPTISGHAVKTIIVPSIDVMYDDAYNALCELRKKGVTVLFQDQIPEFGTTCPVEREERTEFGISTTEEILEVLNTTETQFRLVSDGASIQKARFQRDGHEMWMLVNQNRREIPLSFDHKKYGKATVWDPEDGSVYEVASGEFFAIRSMRACFLVF